MNRDQMQEARDLATLVPQRITAVDTSPSMVVQYVPALGTGKTAATIALAAGKQTMTFTTGGTTPAGLDAIGNSSGIVDLTSSTYDTMGELVDYINGKIAWRAYLVGALRADASSGLLVKTAASAYGDNGLTFYSDTSASKEVSTAISGEKFVNNSINGHVKDAGDLCENAMLYASINVTGVSAQVLKYYEGEQGTTETQLGSTVALTSATAKEQGEANFQDPYIKASRGKRLIVRAVAASSVAPSVPTVVVHGQTVVLKNNRYVDEVNY